MSASNPKKQGKLRVGMVGYKFMGKAHSNAYRAMPMFFSEAPLQPEMAVICGRDPEGTELARSQFGWQELETDWRKLVQRDDIDIIDINTPSDSHLDIAIAAAQSGKHILCEKPLAVTLQDARKMLHAAEKAGVKHMTGFNYRFVPAVRLAKKLLDEGRVGKIYHFRARFLQDWLVDPEFPLVWRLRKEIAGSGAQSDLGAHIVDLARYLVGEFEEVVGMSETFIKERPLPRELSGNKDNSSTERGQVTVDDAAVFMARLEGGVLGSFEASRCAPGHRSLNTFEINGSEGSIRFDFERMNELSVYFTGDDDDVQGFRRILCTDPAHEYADAWWPPGHTIGFEHTFTHEVLELMNAIAEDRLPSPSFADGVRCQEVLEAVEQSIAERRWVSLAELAES
ncbi:Gfo/Idh/MocA family oxidoreductase [Paenibacillus pasadenensis]|uniref:Gfo/Idh/MocA family protein n=1 Tax=Paenibacillus pasadenensis TaxID=217090 RepID=UPI00203B602E|nr:Gfo/Idh/MocA family oxidoreductase [Paenibacillus pasadenensis]MCM3749722.1 Gfo/Idh/MocA family oxidoreductase [Paenibacillus pasadenensis]